MLGLWFFATSPELQEPASFSVQVVGLRQDFQIQGFYEGVGWGAPLPIVAKEEPLLYSARCVVSYHVPNSVLKVFLVPEI